MGTSSVHKNCTTVEPCRLLVTYSDPKEAGMRLAVLDPASGSLSGLATPYSAFGPLSAVPRPGGRIALALVGGQPTRPSEAALLEVSSLQHVTVTRGSI